MRQSDSRIGFVGVGRMGANMARRLRDQQEAIVAVYDRDHATATDLATELGCEAAATPARVAEVAGIIFTVVSDDAAMRQIFSATDTESLLRHAKDRLFMNCATLSPAVHVDVETLVTQRGGQSLEACMASSITQARQGTLYLMCGGRPDVFESAKPLLGKIERAPPLYRIGRRGCEGQSPRQHGDELQYGCTGRRAWAWSSPRPRSDDVARHLRPNGSRVARIRDGRRGYAEPRP